MKGLELKIVFKNSKAYLTTDRPIWIQQPHLSDYVKKFKSFAFWTIRVINYTEAEKKIFCEVLSYQNGKTGFNPTHKQFKDKLNDLQIVSFRKISTYGLLSTIGKTHRSTIPRAKYIKVDKPQRLHQIKPVKHHINETFYVPLKHVNFNIGYVSFEKKFHEYPKNIELKITNDDIREEYDAVKNYFANVLNTKKIQVRVNIEIEDDKITLLKVNSPEIDRINKQLIDEVKFDFIKSTTKKKTSLEKENGLFTIEEYFETFANEDFELKTFYHKDEDFLEDLLKVSNTKHYKHLRLLSSKHSHNIMKLRFIHKPFSFIFLVKGLKYYHFVWETLDTKEATYVWHITKEMDILKKYLVKIEEIIKAIKIDGKLEYISNTEDKFNRIYHDYSDSKNGFIKWKGELERVLI